MANTISIAGTVNLNNNSLLTKGVLTNTLTLSSLNNMGSNIQLTGSQWSSIPSGSATNLRYFFASNNDISASFLLTTNSASVPVQYMSVLQPGDSLVLPYSGSPILYATLVGSITTASLQYIYCQS